MPRFSHPALLRLTGELLAAGGFPAADARFVAGLLVKAELRGYAGHGVNRIPSYVSWIQSGTLSLNEKPQIVREGKATALIDGHHYIGQAAARMAMELAIAKARQHGAGVVALRRAGHIGRLADYMEMAADEGMIAMGAVSVGAGNTALYGGMERVTGTNPMAFAIPRKSGRHIVLDFATSAISMGELQKKVARGEPLANDVMRDGYGHPTTSFKAFRGPPRGTFMAFGGYKGSGLSLVSEILGGLLSGNGPGKSWWDSRGHAVNGVFLQAVSIEEFAPLDEFFGQVDDLVSFIKSTRPAPGCGDILLPGERARANEARRRKEGVEIDASTWEELTQLARKLAVDLPEPEPGT